METLAVNCSQATMAAVHILRYFIVLHFTLRCDFSVGKVCVTKGRKTIVVVVV